MMTPLDRVELRRMAEAVTRAEIEHGVFIRRRYTVPIITLLHDLEATEARAERWKRVALDELDRRNASMADTRAAVLADDEAAR